MREYWLTTDREGFSLWTEEDLPLAKELWGDPEVTKFISASGIFTDDVIENRLKSEIANYKQYGIQYFPIFSLETGELIGVCGLRPYGDMDPKDRLEEGVHLKKKFWRQKYGTEAMKAMIDYAFDELKTNEIFVGHNPKNEPSRGLIQSLGFRYLKDDFYEPTGLYHPSYTMAPDERP